MNLFSKKTSAEQVSEMWSSVYAVFDTKAQLHLQPFLAINDAIAMRGFVEQAQNPNHFIGKHPEDYCLFKLAEFDSVKGIYKNLDRALNLATASSFVVSKN